MKLKLFYGDKAYAFNSTNAANKSHTLGIQMNQLDSNVYAAMVTNNTEQANAYLEMFWSTLIAMQAH